MAIGVVSDSEFEHEVTNSTRSPLPPFKSDAVVMDTKNGGRKKGDNNVPKDLRKLIGEEAAINGSKAGKQMAEAFNISSSSVSAYKAGTTSTSKYAQKNSELLEFINAGKLKLANRARSRLASTLRQITDTKLENADIKELAAVASAMRGVIRDMTPTLDNSSGSVNVHGPSIIMYNPGFQKEEDFETIDMINETSD